MRRYLRKQASIVDEKRVLLAEKLARRKKENMARHAATHPHRMHGIDGSNDARAENGAKIVESILGRFARGRHSTASVPAPK